MDDNWFIQLDLGLRMTFVKTENFYFKSVNLAGLDDQKILTEITNPNQFMIFNLKASPKGT